MIHPAIVNDEVVLMTRMGRTDVAIKAERHLNEALRRECRVEIEANVTPIFEFTAPDNRIVVRYEQSGLSLLALRWNKTGDYLDREYAAAVARAMGLPLVTHHPSDWNSGQAFLDYARAVTGREGFVVRFDSGLWVKAKGEDYVLKHKAKDSILQEKNVLALIIRGELDDVLPLLDESDREHVEAYRDDVNEGMAAAAIGVSGIVTAGQHLDQKSFATEHIAKCAPAYRHLAFMVRAGTPALDAVRSTIEKNLGSQSAVDAARHLHGAQWSL